MRGYKIGCECLLKVDSEDAAHCLVCCAPFGFQFYFAVIIWTNSS